MSDGWVAPEDDPRPTGSPDGELATLRQYLDHYRTTLRMKCEDLDAEQLARRSVPPSTLSLLGLVRHMAYVEHHWFRQVLRGQRIGSIYSHPDDRDHEFTTAVADPEVVAESFATWEAQIADADRWLDSVTDADLGRRVARHGEDVAVRDVLVHLVEEYARHAGPADLLREGIDGRTGQ